MIEREWLVHLAVGGLAAGLVGAVAVEMPATSSGSLAGIRVARKCSASMTPPLRVSVISGATRAGLTIT
jgi:hypothetical protein